MKEFIYLEDCVAVVSAEYGDGVFATTDCIRRHEPMKDHEFAIAVNNLTRLARKYGGTQQLRSRMAMFLTEFKDMINE